MKNLLLLFSMLFVGIGFAQNKSDGTVQATSLPGQEVFRFKTGLVTQLVDGNFNFFDGYDNDQWFSLGKLTIPSSQELFGLRFQRQGVGLTFGIQEKINEDQNLFVEWIGRRTGGLNFRVASSPTQPSTTKQVMKLRDNATVLIGQKSAHDANVVVNFENPFIPEQREQLVRAKQEIYNTDNYNGLTVYNEGKPQTQVSRVETPRRAGYFYQSSPENINVGIESSVQKTFSSTISRNSYTFGIVSRAEGAANNYGIYSSANTYAGYFNGNIITTGTSTTLSDARFKENIKTDTRALEKIKGLNPVSYTMKEVKGINLAEGIQHGFIAQELEEIYPELVKEVQIPNTEAGDSEEKYKSVNYTGLISILTKGIQELSAEVESLKKQVENNTKTYVVYTRDISLPTMEELEQKGYYLAQNTPNPFRGRTVIDYNIPSDDKNASIFIMDLNGQVVKEFKLNQEKGSVVIEAGTLNKGIYLYSLISNNTEVLTKKMIAQ